MDESTYDGLQPAKTYSTNVYRGKEIGGYSVTCFGAVVVPRSCCTSCWAWFLIITPSVLQMTLVNPYYKDEVVIDTFYVLSLFLTLLFLFLTTFTDPGVIPREDPRDQMNKKKSKYQ